MNDRSQELPLLLAVLLVACAEEAPDAPDPEALPCDVDEVLETRCRTCHADPPRNGAPMPLDNHADTSAPSLTDPAKPVSDRMAERIHAESAPMPPANSPTGPLTEEESAILDAWLATGAPARVPEQGCDPPDDDDPDDDDPDDHPDDVPVLPCTPSHTLLAFGETDDGFAVPADADNLYQCFVLPSPFADGEQATALAPVIDDSRAVHHIIVYSTPAELEPGTSFECSRMAADVEFVWGWAPGGSTIEMPDDVGLALPAPTDRLLIQVHYHNIAGFTDVRDASGVQLCTVETPRAEEAGIVRLGAQGFVIPRGAEDFPVVAECAVPDDARIELQVLGAGPHMHEAGDSIATEILRGGREDRIETLVRVDPWDFQSQTFHDVDQVIRGGDVLRTTCRYTNPSTTDEIRNGEATEDEMCLDFVMLYPYGPIQRSGRTRCVETVR